MEYHIPGTKATSELFFAKISVFPKILFYAPFATKGEEKAKEHKHRGWELNLQNNE